MSDTGESLANLPIGDIETNPLQPRGMITNESLKELVDSIKEHGVLEPLVVAQTPAGYQMIAGERRWRAARLAGLKSIPVIVKKTTARGMLEMALVENVQRTDLNVLDRAKAFDRLIKEFDLTPTKIAKRISKSPSYVSNTLKMLKLPDALTDGLLTGAITEGHARALSMIDNHNAMMASYKRILRESGSVRLAEELARNYRNSQNRKAPEPEDLPKNQLIVTEELKRMEKQLRRALGEFSSVSLKQSSRMAKISIVFNGLPSMTARQVEAVYKALKDIDFEA